MPSASPLDAKLGAIGSDGYVGADEVLELRRTLLADGVAGRADLEALFALGERAPQGDPQWPVLFAEVCADYLLDEEEPEGYLTDEEFAWLKALVTRNGSTASPLELTALIRVMHRARQVPAAMTGFLADQLRLAVARRTQGTMTGQMLALVRLYLYAAGGAGSIGISRDEADLLFDLHDLTLDGDNAPGWRELFVKAITAHLMQHVGYTPLPREEALRLNGWVSDTGARPGGFLAAMLRGGLRAISEAYEREDEHERRNALAAREADRARRITDDEAAWLMGRMARNGQFDEAEKAVLVYLRDHLNAALPAPLAELADAITDGDAPGEDDGEDRAA